jgi:Tfp pilus assembly protein PilF
MLGCNKNIMLVGLCVLALGGCSTLQSCDDGLDVRLLRTPTEFMVNNGIKNYEDGNYSASMNILQNLVENRDATKGEKLLAYKYLAFNYCLSSKEKLCRESFRKALELDSSFKLSPAEAGHPVWGPIFSSVKNTPAK